MNPSARLFRGLMLGSLVLGIISLVIGVAFPELIPEPIRQADELVGSSMRGWVLVLSAITLVLFVGANVGAFIGLYLFKRWARETNVALSASLFVIWPLLEYNVSSGWAQAFSDAAMLLWGAVLGLAYFSPISAKFEPNNTYASTEN